MTGTIPGHGLAIQYLHPGQPLDQYRRSFISQLMKKNRMYQKILTGVDGSAESMRALRETIGLARMLHATVDVLYVIPPQIYSQFSERDVIVRQDDGKDHRISLLQKEENELSDMIRSIAAEEGYEVTIHTRVGDAVEGLVDYSSSNDIDLVVVGSSGKGMADRLILGSVSTGVVHRSRVPVLVIKPKK
jgi:nucleotide-binding universal stress UspA family protein